MLIVELFKQTTVRPKYHGHRKYSNLFRFLEYWTEKLFKYDSQKKNNIAIFLNYNITKILFRVNQ